MLLVKTQIHRSKCKFLGQSGHNTCHCPLRRAAGSVDSLIGQVEQFFAISAVVQTNGSLGIGNPAASPIIKRHLNAVRLEQSTSAVIPRQAVALFMNKLGHVIRNISYRLYNGKNANAYKVHAAP